MPKAVRTVVFPVAGRGTRFLPVTKSVPKELLPIIDRPLIDYAVAEATAAGVTRPVFVNHNSKGAIENHFAADVKLEAALKAAGKTDQLALVRDVLPPGVTCSFVEQAEPLGLGHAVLCARELVGDEPFFVHLPDDLIRADTGCLQQMQDAFQSRNASLVAVESVPPEKTSSYGIAAVDSDDRLQQIVEKPAPADAPSNLGIRH